MDDILSVITSNTSIIIIVMSIIIICLTIVTLINIIKVSGLRKRIQKLLQGTKNKNLENVILEYYSKIDDVNEKNNSLMKQLNKVQDTLEQCAQKIGVIRYNAFENMGSDLSFAVAVLDKNDNGFVLNGVYSRESSATYLKPIKFGASEYTLSEEEIKAIEVAKNNFAKKLMQHSS
jgi:hypothetical protein